MLPISIVIASLGKENLKQTLNSIINQPFDVYEIIVVLPPFVTFNFFSKKIIFLNSPKKGQVAQRSYGLKHSSAEYVIQMDDDVVIQNNTIYDLYKVSLNYSKNVVFAPLLCSLKDNNQIIPKFSLVSYWFHFILGAPANKKLRSGFLSKNGFGYALNDMSDCNVPTKVGWLPGAFVYCHRDFLIADDYFPFNGRAYSEDLLHSFLWQQKGCIFLVDPRIRVSMEYNPITFNVKSIYSEFIVKKYLSKIMGGHSLAVYLWCIFKLLKFIVKRT